MPRESSTTAWSPSGPDPELWTVFFLLDVFPTKLYCFLGGKNPETVSHLLLSCPTLLCEQTLLFPVEQTHGTQTAHNVSTALVVFVVQSLRHIQHVDCSTPGIPVLLCFPEFILTHVHWVDDAIQPSHPLSPPSLPALNLSQHQGLFQWINCLHQVAKELALPLLYAMPKVFSQR